VNGATPAGPGGGLLDATHPSQAVIDLLLANADQYTWVAATVGSNNAAGYQLTTGKAVMPIGGFNGSDPYPTLDQFKQLVADKKIHYFLGSVRFPNNGGSNDAANIALWVGSNFSWTAVDGVQMYDLTQPASLSSSRAAA
jgi:hypothetical protein